MDDLENSLIEDEEEEEETETSPTVEAEIEETETVIDEMYEGLLGTITVNVDARHSQYLPNQHTVSAITGLTETLDDIQALKDTLYSKNTNLANYYLWDDENPLQENRNGYFVYINEDNKLEICSNQNNVFGVTVDDAGFIGGQDEIERDYKYALVANSGLVKVRCELNVVADDYVRPNTYGRAKENAIYGYKVIAVNEIGNDRYATISLSSTFDSDCDINDRVDSLEDRMYSAETNIASTTNLANSAYHIAQSSLDAVRLANEANDKAISALNSVEDLEDGVNTAVANAEQALTIANATSAIAVNIRNEAIAAANQSLAEVVGAIEEVQESVDNIDQTIDNALLEARSTFLDDLETATPIMNIQGFIDNGYITIANWPSDPTSLNTSRVYYVTNENPHYYHYYNGSSWTTSSTASGAGLTESIMHLKQTVDENSSSISSLTSRIGRNCVKVDSFNTSAGTYTIGETTDDADTAKVYYNKVSENYCYYYYNGSWSLTDSPSVAGLSESVALIQQTVNENESKIEEINTWMGDNSSGAVKSIADVTSKVNEHESEITSLTSWKDDTDTAITSVTQTANASASAITSLTNWKDTTDTAIASLQQIVGPDGARLEGLVANIDKYRVGDYSQANGLTFAQAVDILDVGSVYAPTVSHTEIYTGSPNVTTNFTRGYYYTWTSNGWSESASTMVNFSDVYVSGNSSTPYWYVNSGEDVEDNDDNTYTAHSLYHWNSESSEWEKVVTLNSLGRSVGLLQAKADQISLSVSNANGAIGQLQTRVANDEAQTSMIASMVTDNSDITISGTVANTAALPSGQNNNTYYAVGSAVPYYVYKYDGTNWNKIDYLSYDGTNVKEVSAASIINTVNDSGSEININADKINFTGFTTFLRPSDVGSSGSTTIDGARITTGTINTGRLSASGIIQAINSEGSTTINGGKITTNSITTSQLATDAIKSNNYAANTSGTYLNLTNGVFDSPNFKINANGNVTANNMTLTGGTIQSANYSANNYGTQIDLSTGAIDTKNFKVDSQGNITANSGTFNNVTIGSSCTVAGQAVTGDITIESITINNNNGTVTLDTSDINGNSALEIGYLKGTYFRANYLTAQNTVFTPKLALDGGGDAEVDLTYSGVTLSGTLYPWSNIFGTTKTAVFG